MKKIGFVGYGLRSKAMMNAFKGLEADISVVAIVDPNYSTFADSLKEDPYFSNVICYESTEDMLEQAALDGVFIGTRCDLHTQYAALVLQKNIPLFLEKPVCINKEQYKALLSSSNHDFDNTIVSFPLRLTCIVEEMHKLVSSGELGDIATVQAINNVPYGSVYYHSWYRDEEITGGLFLQKATHDVDYISYILGKDPISAFAQTGKMYFKGDKPAGLRCPDCSHKFTCPESSYVIKHIKKENPTGDLCCFAKDTGNEDVASAIFTCKDGTIISYNQTFLVKNDAGRRGARFVGMKASAEFDFYTGEIQVNYYHDKHNAIHTFAYPNGMHFGGDDQLALHFLSLMDGKKSHSNLAAGLSSAAICLAAKESALTGKLTSVDYGFNL